MNTLKNFSERIYTAFQHYMFMPPNVIHVPLFCIHLTYFLLYFIQRKTSLHHIEWNNDKVVETRLQTQNEMNE